MKAVRFLRVWECWYTLPVRLAFIHKVNQGDRIFDFWEFESTDIHCPWDWHLSLDMYNIQSKYSAHAHASASCTLSPTRIKTYFVLTEWSLHVTFSYYVKWGSPMNTCVGVILRGCRRQWEWMWQSWGSKLATGKTRSWLLHGECSLIVGHLTSIKEYHVNQTYSLSRLNSSCASGDGVFWCNR